MTAYQRANYLVMRTSLIIRSIWAACLLAGGANHALTLFRHGIFWDYGGVARASAVYWSSLTVLDPLAAALLFARPKAGIVVTLILIITNVIHNLAITANRAPTGEFLVAASNLFVVSQIGFMVLVLVTTRVAWRGIGSTTRRHPFRRD